MQRNTVHCYQHCSCGRVYCVRCALFVARQSSFERDVVLDITLLHTVDFCRSFLSVAVFGIRGPPFCYGILKFKLTAFAGLSTANPTCLVRGQRCQRKREGSVRRIVSVTFNFNFADCGGHLLVETPEGFGISFSPIFANKFGNNHLDRFIDIERCEFKSD